MTDAIVKLGPNDYVVEHEVPLVSRPPGAAAARDGGGRGRGGRGRGGRGEGGRGGRGGRGAAKDAVKDGAGAKEEQVRCCGCRVAWGKGERGLDVVTGALLRWQGSGERHWE